MACDCNSNAACACTFTSSGSVAIAGGGSSDNPIVISIETAVLTVEDTDTVQALISGDGSVEFPYVISFRADPALLDTMWGRWFGSQAQYDSITDQPGILYVVNPLA